MQYRNYLLKWFITLLVLIVLIAGLNYLIDPYGIFNVKRFEGVNELKPAAINRARLAKPYQVMHSSARGLIIGNSRTEIGLDPNHMCWSPQNLPVYNYGLPGASIYMVYRNLQHAIATSPVRTVLLGLDFKDFLKVPDTGLDQKNISFGHAPFEKRMIVRADGSNNPYYEWNVLRDRLLALFSLDSLKDSFHTISKQADKYSSTITKKGFNPANDLKSVIKLEGQGIIFKQKNIEISKHFSNTNQSIFDIGADSSVEFEQLEKLLEYADAHSVRVILFTNPYHADYLLIMEMLGWWPKFEKWKRKLTDIAVEYGVVLWDFSNLNEYASETPPERGDKKALLKWYWEPAHYRSELGGRMLQRIFKENCDAENESSFGDLLTHQNIDNHLLASRKAMKEYKRKNKDAIQRLTELR